MKFLIFEEILKFGGSGFFFNMEQSVVWVLSLCNKVPFCESYKLLFRGLRVRKYIFSKSFWMNNFTLG